MTNILETYTHDPEHYAFKEFKKASPAKWATNPAMDEEHTHLSILHRAPRNPQHTEILQDHTASSQALNMALVVGRPGEYTKNKARTISHAITDNLQPLETEHHVYSGLGDFNPHAILEHSGGVFKAKHFISASIDPDIAMRHDNHKRMMGSGGTQQTDSHILHFHLPKGYAKGRYIAPLSEFAGEHEFLLDREQHWKVDNVQTIHGQHHVTGAPLTRTIWSVKPHTPEAAVKEEVEHRLHDYFDDSHPGMSMADWDKKQYSGHPDYQEFEAHAAHLRSLTLGKTTQLPKQDLQRQFSGDIHHKAISIYSRGSESINDSLLNKDVPAYIADSHKQAHGQTIHQTIDQISKGIRDLNHPLEHHLHVYSGSNHPGLLDGSIGVGSIIHTPAFTSTSIKHNIAKGFGWNHVDPKNPDAAHHIIHFELPPRFNKGAYIQPHSWMEHEHEYLLDKDQKWKVKEHNIVKTRDPSRDRNGIINRHVWTVVPHEESIHEALVHVPQLFKDRRVEVDHKDKPELHKASMEMHDMREQMGVVHHEHLMKTHAFTPDGQEQATVNRYTRGSSEELNTHLLQSPEERKKGEEQIVQSYNMWQKSHSDPEAKSIADVPHDYNYHSHHDQYAERLSGIIEKHAVPLDHEAHVYSGVGFDPSEHFKHADGIIHMPAFTSTSLNVSTPLGFGKSFNRSHERTTKEVKPFIPHHARTFTDINVTQAKLVTDKNSDEKHIIHFKLPVGYKKGLYIQPHSNYKEEHEYLLDKNQKWKLEKHEEVSSWTSYRYQSLDGYKSHAAEKATIKNKTKRHIWTVVPHEDEKPVTESMVHVPSMFAQKKPYSDERNVHFDKQREHMELAQQFGNVHEEHLLKTHAFTPSQGDKNSIYDYTRFGSKKLNPHLLGEATEHTPEMKESLNEDAKTISGIIRKHAVPLDHEAHVYSGVGFDPGEHFKANNGVIHMPAFTSTSLNYDLPTQFGRFFNEEKSHEAKLSTKPGSGELVKKTFNKIDRDKHIIHFKLPVGYKKGLYVAPHSRYKEEHEYLLDKGQKWRLEKHETVNSWNSMRTKEAYPWRISSEPKEFRNTEKYKTKTHIWTVVPHEDAPVHEALVHDTSLLKEREFHVRQSWTTFKAHKDSIDSAVAASYKQTKKGREMGEEHHEHLLAHNSYNIHDGPAEDYDAVNRYTGSYSSKLNKHLINPESSPSYLADEFESDAKHLSSVIKKHATPLKAESHFYSAVGFDPSKHFEEGNGTIHMPAFISSSANPHLTREFGNIEQPKTIETAKKMTPKEPFEYGSIQAGQKVDTIVQQKKVRNHHVIHFKCPPGYKGGLYIAPHSKIEEEHEFLLDKGQKWKLEKHEVIRGFVSERFEGAVYHTSDPYGGNTPVKRSYKTKVNRHVWTVVPHTDTP